MTTATKTISFTSGKGGVGKSLTTLNLAVALQQRGNRVLVLDADLGLANIDVMIGLTTNVTLTDVLEGRVQIEDVIQQGPEGISIIPAATGIEQMSKLSPDEKNILCHQLEQSCHSFDYLLVDTQAGIGSDGMFFCSAANEIVCVVSGDLTSITDAYAIIKVLSSNYSEKRFSILVNNVEGASAAERVFNRLCEAVERFLHVQLRYLGYIPNDQRMTGCIASQRALMDCYPSSPAGIAYATIAKRIDLNPEMLQPKGGMQFFLRQLVEGSSESRTKEFRSCIEKRV